MTLKTSKRIVWIGITWCFASIFIGFGVGQLTQDVGYQTLHDEASDRLLSSIHRVRGELNAYHYLPFLLTQNEDVIQQLTSPHHSIDENLAAKVSRYLEQTNLVAGASGLFIVNRAGLTVAYSNWRDQQHLAPDEFADLPLFQLAEKGEEGRFYENSPDKRAYYYLSAPIYNRSDFVGAAIVRIELSSLLSESDTLPDELFTVSDDTQHIFMASNEQWLERSLDRIAEPSYLSLTNGVQAQLWTLNQQRYIAHQVRLDDLGWTFTTLISARLNERFASLIGAITMAGLWILGVILLFLRERRLKHLSQRETRAVLARNEEQQRSIIGNTEVGLLTLNTRGEIGFLNSKAAQQFNLPLSQAIGQKLNDLLLDVEPDSALGKGLMQLHRPQFSPIIGAEAKGVSHGKTPFPALISLRDMHHSEDNAFLVTVVDISRRKQLEQALLDANESLEHKVKERTQALEMAQQELIQTSKMAALGRMSTAIVHELNQPLTAMRTYIAISKQLLHDPELVKENLTLLDDLTQRMAIITSQLKTFAYKKPEQLQAVNLQTAINQCAIVWRARLEEDNISLTTTGLQSNHNVLADNARMEQILVNLIGNACDALQDQSNKQIYIHSEQNDLKSLTITIEDNGPGIPESQREHLFEPFYTTKPMGQGLGLGLSIVAAIVRDLQGSIHVDASPYGGARFILTLPSTDTN